jgi:hypothetical protein
MTPEFQCEILQNLIEGLFKKWVEDGDLKAAELTEKFKELLKPDA